MTIARNLALDKMKRVTAHLASLDSMPVNEQAKSHNPYERIFEQDRLQFVRNLIDQLPEKQRTCMQLRDVEGKPYKEIASILNMTEQQVKINIFRARQTIKEEYLKQEKYGL